MTEKTTVIQFPGLLRFMVEVTEHIQTWLDCLKTDHPACTPIMENIRKLVAELQEAAKAGTRSSDEAGKILDQIGDGLVKLTRLDLWPMIETLRGQHKTLKLMHQKSREAGSMLSVEKGRIESEYFDQISPLESFSMTGLSSAQAKELQKSNAEEISRLTQERDRLIKSIDGQIKQNFNETARIQLAATEFSNVITGLEARRTENFERNLKLTPETMEQVAITPRTEEKIVALPPSQPKPAQVTNMSMPITAERMDRMSRIDQVSAVAEQLGLTLTEYVVVAIFYHLTQAYGHGRGLAAIISVGRDSGVFAIFKIAHRDIYALSKKITKNAPGHPALGFYLTFAKQYQVEYQYEMGELLLNPFTAAEVDMLVELEGRRRMEKEEDKKDN